MNKNYTYLFLSDQQKMYFLMCCRTLVTSLCAPRDEKGWKLLGYGKCQEEAEDFPTPTLSPPACARLVLSLFLLQSFTHTWGPRCCGLMADYPCHLGTQEPIFPQSVGP